MPLLARRAAGAFAALRVLAGGTVRASGAVVFAYHDVDDDPANATTYLTSPERLRTQLLSVLSWGLTFVGLGELCDRRARGESLDGLAALTFDDGLHGVYRHALPILRELDIPATVFIVADPRSSAQPWPGSRTMTDDEVRAVAEQGVVVGSHAMSHASLPGLDTDALRAELRDSRARLEELVQRPVDLLAYPYGHHDPRVRAEARNSGYRAACTFLNGRFTTQVDPYRIPRLTMNDQTRARLAYHVARPTSSWPGHQLDEVLDRHDSHPDGAPDRPHGQPSERTVISSARRSPRPFPASSRAPGTRPWARTDPGPQRPMISTLTRRKFSELSAARAALSGPDAEEYWAYHRLRLWDSYRRAARLLPERGSFVSVGAGPGYVEAGLAESHEAQGVIIDFPETLDVYAAQYAAAGLKPVAIDLTTRPNLPAAIGTGFDLALSLEVVEHLPIPPSEHLAPMVGVLRPGGAVLLSTPNAGNLRCALKTLLHRPTLPPAEQTFALVGHENEGVHRREYMRSEIIDAFNHCGLTVTGTGWVSYGRQDGADTIFLPIEWLIPPFRLTMAITGVTKGT